MNLKLFRGRTRRGTPNRLGTLAALGTVSALLLTSLSVVESAPASAIDYNAKNCAVVTNCLVIQPVTADVDAVPHTSAIPWGYQVLDEAPSFDFGLGVTGGTPIFYPYDKGNYYPSDNQAWSLSFTANTAWKSSDPTTSPPPGSFQITNVGNPGTCLAQNGNSSYTEGCSSSTHDYWYLEPDPNYIGGTQFVRQNFRPRDAYMIRNASDGKCLNQYGGDSAFWSLLGQSKASGWDCNNGDLSSDFIIGKVEPGGYDSFNDPSLVNALWDTAGVEATGQCGVHNDCTYSTTSLPSTPGASQCVGTVHQNSGVANMTDAPTYGYFTSKATTTTTTWTYGMSSSLTVGASTTANGVGLTAQFMIGFNFSVAYAFGYTETSGENWASTTTSIVPPGYYYWVATAPVTQQLVGTYKFRQNSWYAWSWTPIAPVSMTTWGSLVQFVVSKTPPTQPCMTGDVRF